MQKTFTEKFLKHIESLKGEMVKYVLVDFHDSGLTLLCGLKKGTPEFHKDIIETAILEGRIPPVHNSSILGGGKCKIDGKNKKIYVLDKSTVFGKPDEIMLQVAFKQQIQKEGFTGFELVLS